MIEKAQISGAGTVSSSNRAPPLIKYTLRGLQSCWMPSIGRWSHIYHLDGRAEPNQSVPSSDVFYSLNVLLGLSKISHYQNLHGYDIPEIFRRCVELVPVVGTPRYSYGIALWAAADLNLPIPSKSLTAITAVVEERNNWIKFSAQDLGMLLTGYVRFAERDPNGSWAATAHELFKYLAERFSCPSGLFYNTAATGRRQFSSFATHTYLTLACFVYGEWASNQRALALAKGSSRKLIELQGPQGEWPWFFYTPAGRVVDYYEIYSVHQEGMAPAFLGHAERHAVPDARHALIRGFNWIFGQNQINRSMLWKREGLICRSQLRKGELDNKYKRAARAVFNAVLGRSAKLVSPSELQLRLECRSYELGWILYSFGRRTDLPEIVNHPEFAESLNSDIAASR